MERLSENIVGGESRTEIFKVGKKKYIRIASPRGVEWKRYKTKHQVKQVEFNALENLYNKKNPVQFVPNAFIKSPRVKKIEKNRLEQMTQVLVKAGMIEDDKERRRIERGMLEASDNGKSKLAAVKYVVQNTDLGLKESKEFVENFLDRREVMLKW
jgi:hypothetical protein